MRELRQRLEDSQAHPDDVTNALALARQFATRKLHHRTFGVGEFGSTLGLAGYALNETGQFLREVFERSLGGTAFTAQLSEPFRHTLIGAEGAAMSYWANRLADMAGNPQQPDDSADLLLYRNNDVLAKALGRRETRPRAEAHLIQRRGHALRTMETFIQDFHKQGHAADLDVDSFIVQLQAFCSLNQLGRKHGMDELAQPDFGALENRIPLYNAALEWSDKDARGKNIQAIRWELDHARSDPLDNRNPHTLQLAANRFWSVRFLKSCKEEGHAELDRLNELYGFNQPSYQAAVASLADLDAMSVPALRSNLMSNAEPRVAKARAWIQNQFTAVGLPRRAPDQLDACVETLKTQPDSKDHPLDAMLQLLQQAFETEVLARWNAEGLPGNGDVPHEIDPGNHVVEEVKEEAKGDNGVEEEVKT